MSLFMSALLFLSLLTALNANQSWWGEKRSRQLAAESLGAPFEPLKRLHQPLAAPGAHDWLANHKEEGQSVRAYTRSGPVRPNEKLRTIHIMLLGEFSEEQKQVVEDCAEYMRLYFDLPVKISRKLPLTLIPAQAQRVHPDSGDKQLLSTYVLDKLLKPQRPADAVAYLAFSSSDLWPGKGWNFVFGQASLRERVGVWSIYRNGDPARSKEDYALCLTRTIKTATHETGHILSMPHCLTFTCNMNGSNHQAESDSRPLALCPACLKKLCWNVGAEPAPRFKKLAAFCREKGLNGDAELFEKSLKLVE